MYRGGKLLFSRGQNLPHESINLIGFPELFTNFHSHLTLIQCALCSGGIEKKNGKVKEIGWTYLW